MSEGVRLRHLARVNPSARELRHLDPSTTVSFVPMDALGERGGMRLDTERPLGELGSGYTYFCDGDVVIAKITPCFENGKGALARELSSGIGFGSTELHVVRAGSELDARFLFYLTISPGFRAAGEAEMNGAGGQKRVPTRFVLDFRVPDFPLERQRAIAELLDRKTAAIEELIANKHRVLELLHEQRRALITRAVTQGLDPDVPMKRSRVEWLGEVPAHWSASAIKRLARLGRKTFTDGDWIEAAYLRDEGVRLIQTGNVGVGEYREQGFRYVSSQAFDALGCTAVEPGDVLICRLDGPVGRACLAPDLGVRMITSVDNAILKTSAEHEPRFVVYALSSQPYLSWVQALCRVGGGHRLRVSRSMLGAIRIPTPPRAEQARIADELDRASARILGVAQRVERQLGALREYRQALIASALAGRLTPSSIRHDRELGVDVDAHA